MFPIDLYSDVKEPMSSSLEEIVRDLSKRFKFLNKLGTSISFVNIFTFKDRFAEPRDDLIQGDIKLILRKCESRPKYRSVILELGESVLKKIILKSFLKENAACHPLQNIKRRDIFKDQKFPKKGLSWGYRESGCKRSP